MKRETKAILTLLIAEVQFCKNMDEIAELLKSWINANDLHPEEVKTYGSLEELRMALKQEEDVK